MRTGECNGCAACCRFVILQVNPQYMEADKRSWIEMHGIRLFEQDGGTWARITATCQHLTAENKCSIHDTRPQTCRDFPAVQSDIDIVDAFVGERVCSYSFVEGVAV